jgi:hypothetical protein
MWDDNSETITVGIYDYAEAMSGALVLGCRSAEMNVADIAVQGDSRADTVPSRMQLLDRMIVTGKDGKEYSVTYLNTTKGQDVNGEFHPTGVTLRVELVSEAR